MKPQIAFIGLGAMGFPMAERLLAAGYPMKVAVHKNREKVTILAKQGAEITESFAEAVRGAKLIFSILPADAEMRDLYLDERILMCIEPDAVVIEMTSATMSVMQEIGTVLKARGIRVLDCPVSGGISGANNGTLTLIVGGDPDVLEEVREPLMCIANNIYHVGALGTGKGLKAVNQMLVGIHMAAIAQALALAEKIGVSEDKFYEVVSHSSGDSKVLNSKFPMIKSRHFEQGFQMKLMKKDLKNALHHGEGLDLSMLKQAIDLFERVPEEMALKDFSVVSDFVRSQKY